ncbi:MAG TPA: hypothetical protein ENN09_06450 [Planctomycetes bacterium]|nr:hypothetical protein [Planctomycetota bacterium]
MDRVCDEIAAVSEYAAQRGMKGIFLEQMHRPQLQPNTIGRAQHMIGRINSKSAVPVHIHIDTGHMAHVRGDPVHGERDRNPLEWLGTPFGANEMLLIHAQQTDDQASRHWPFTAEYNRRGIIDPLKVIRAVERSGVREAVVALEILFLRGTRIEDIEAPLLESAQCWRDAFAAAGYAEKDATFAKKES